MFHSTLGLSSSQRVKLTHSFHLLTVLCNGLFLIQYHGSIVPIVEGLVIPD